MMEISQLQKFISDFQTFERGLGGGHVKEEINNYQTLLQNYVPLYEEYNKRKAYDAPEFNIFDIIGFSRLEALLHTPFITHLLHEKESHAQGSLFFEEFIRLIFPDLHSSDISKVYIKRELNTGDLGIIDIYIQFYVHNKPYYVVVENKIDAGDQEKQLQRYHDHIMAKNGSGYETFRLIYLTKYGTTPTIGYTMESQLYEKLTQSGVLVLWSYQREIMSWLLSSLPHVKSPLIRIVIEQYLKTIKNI